MPENYDLLLERISSSAGLDKAEVEKRVEARRAKLSGLISKEGAAQIIAAELGVKFDNIQLKISELMAGMKKVNVLGKVISIFPVRSFDKNGKSGKVANLIIADETGNSRVVLWDTNHIALIENGEIKQNDVVQITNASTREGEIHLSGFSELKKSNVVLTGVKTEKSFTEKAIESLQEGNNVSVRGTVVQIFDPRFFSVCPTCGKKVVADAEGFSCAEHGKVSPKEKALLNFVMDDGTDSLRVVLFSDQLEKLISLEKLRDGLALVDFKTDLLGTELSVKGIVRKNALFNNLELTGNELTKVDPNILSETLEKEN
jgi:ssDNA-binding replication factor A large subunit